MATEAHTSERAPASVIEQRMKNAAKLAAIVGIPSVFLMCGLVRPERRLARSLVLPDR
jgi:hypothetical protein